MKKIIKKFKNAGEGYGAFLTSLTSKSTQDFRKKAMNTEIGNQVVDTVLPADTDTWETGIKRKGIWIIVQQYPDKKSATKGHAKWVEDITRNPKIKLKDIDLWNIGK